MKTLFRQLRESATWWTLITRQHLHLATKTTGAFNIPLSFTRVENIVQSLLAARLFHARGSEWGVWRWLHKPMRTRGWSDEDVDLGRDL